MLAAVDVGERVQLVLDWARNHVAELQVAESIRNDVTEGVDKQQREYLLRQQLEAIRKELGEGDGDVVAEYRTKLAELQPPEAAYNSIAKEIDRLERTSSQSPEHGWIRTWLDRVFELPWSTRSDDNLDLANVRAVLDADHYGLDDVKARIVEFMAVRKLRSERGLAGDDGDGDGGRPAAPSRGDHHARRSAGRRQDEPRRVGGPGDGPQVRARRPRRHPRRGRDPRPPAHLRRIAARADRQGDGRGRHRQPGDPPRRGRQAVTRRLVGRSRPRRCSRCSTRRRTTRSATTTSSSTSTSPTSCSSPPPTSSTPSRRRCSTAWMSSASTATPTTRRCSSPAATCCPRQLERAGLQAGELDVDDATIVAVIRNYTREAGVRSLERELGRLARKAAAKIAAGDAVPDVAPGELREWLGRPKLVDDVPDRTELPGVATGLAVTGAGGDVLFIETTAFPTGPDTEPGLTLTGQLGDVMKESAQIALNYVRSHAGELGVEPESMRRRFHVHVPAGAVPKDGPSAGITMTTALVSLLRDQAVKPTVGMTGEITLQGAVLPIGGVKQKVLAAHRAGLTEVVLPKRNEGDLDDVPEQVREAMTFHLADTYADVVAAAFAN